MTLHEIYDMPISNGSSAGHLVIVEYCNLNNLEVRDIENNKNKGFL